MTDRALAAGLLENEAVQKWVARSFPLILVDEAQDLDEYRMRILQGLSPSCRIVAAADAFQCLQNGRDTAHLMGWLEGAGQTHRLTQVRRTTQQGLLAAALAVREGRDILFSPAEPLRIGRHGTVRVSGFKMRSQRRGIQDFSRGRLLTTFRNAKAQWSF